MTRDITVKVTLAMHSSHLPRDTKMKSMGGTSKNVIGLEFFSMIIATATTMIE